MDGDRSGKTIGQIQVTGSMRFEVYEPGGGTQWPRRKCRCHGTGKGRGGRG
jgi:hypothetical protein